MLNSLTVVTIPQCIFISEYHIVHLKYIQFLFVKYTSIKLGKKEKKKKEYQGILCTLYPIYSSGYILQNYSTISSP